MPKGKPHTLISTVGTSLLGNLSRLPEKPLDAEENRESKGPEGLDWATVAKLKRHYRQGEWKALGQCLTEVPGHARLCGAEINSIYALSQKDWLDIREIVFLVSDTKEGKNTGEVLTTYFESVKDALGLQNVRYSCIEGLQDERPWEFRTTGLRNLVREVGKVVQRVGGPQYVAIDATGGYKAQIAVAALIGVAMDIDVYYRHERFDDIISFPPLPVALDYSLVGKYGNTIHAFEKEPLLTEDEIGPIDEELVVLLDREVIDGETCWALSPIGEIYLTGYRMRYPKAADLRSATSEEREVPRFPDHHYPNGFKQFVTKVWQETPWITRCVTVPYSKQEGMKKTGFYLREGTADDKPTWEIIGEYIDHEGFGGRFKVLTTADQYHDLVWAVDQLNQKFAD
ncbi:MAG TPA: putative CRISPR-associated protein [Petrimonas sp.]|nr:putative CRISPR-associated protein [Petrimonas sp.]